jgi:hypothetical protein
LVINKNYDVDGIERIIDDVINGRKNPFTETAGGKPLYTWIPNEGNLRYNVIQSWRVQNKISDKKLYGYLSKAPDKTNLPNPKIVDLGSDIKKVEPKSDIKVKAKINLTAQFLNAWFEKYMAAGDYVAKLIKVDTKQKAVNEFDKLLKGAIDKVLIDPSDAGVNAYKTALNQAFFKLGRTVNMGIDYKRTWDNLKDNIKSQFEGDALTEVTTLLDDIEKYNSDNSLISIKDAIETFIVDKNASATFWDKVQKQFQKVGYTFAKKTARESFDKNLPSIWERLLSYATVGLYKSPKRMVRDLIKQGYRKKTTLRNAAVRAIGYYLVLPSLGGTLEWAFDSIMKDTEYFYLVGEETEVTDLDEYILDWLRNGPFNDLLENDPFVSDLNAIIPGFIDDLVAFVVLSINRGREKNVTAKVDKIKNDLVSVKKEIQELKDFSAKTQNLTIVQKPNTAKYFSFMENELTRVYGYDEGIKISDILRPYFVFTNPEGTELISYTSTYKKLSIIVQGQDPVKAIDDNGRGYTKNQLSEFGMYAYNKKENNELLSMESLKEKILSSEDKEKTITGKIKELGDDLITKETKLYNISKKLIKESMEEGKKFGEDNFKHWKDTFKFKKYDEKTNHLKDVKITAKMDEIMDRIDHFRKKYDEDDSFVRAVIDVYGTGIDIIQYTKGLAHLTEGVIVGGLLGVLSTIRESKELVTWTVKHYKDGNWELVKGNFNKKELLNVGKTKRERDERQKESDNPAEGLKKKEQESIMILSRDEKEGLNGLPTKVKQKVKEKLRQGWSTEKPFDFLNTYYSESEINSVFNDKIKIYKLKPSAEFFRTLAKNSSKVTFKKGFCKSVKNAKGEYDLSEREKNTLNHFISKCESKFGV